MATQDRKTWRKCRGGPTPNELRRGQDKEEDCQLKWQTILNFNHYLSN